MSRTAIEVGPVGPRTGSWEDDEPGDDCSACKGWGTHENPDNGYEYDCPICDGSGVSS